MQRATIGIAAALALTLTAACKSNDMGDTLESAGDTIAAGASSVADGAISLVNVDLSNVLNDLALDLNIDKANIPVNAQVPITIAANICGVSINILSVSTGGQANCTATSTSPDLTQVVQQQIAAGGSVGGGSQGTTSPATETTTDGQTAEPDPSQPQ